MPKSRARAKAAIRAGAEGRAGDVAGGSCPSNFQPVANQRPYRRAHGPPQRPTDSHLPVHGERSNLASGWDRPFTPRSLSQTLCPATPQTTPLTVERHCRRHCSSGTPRTFRAFTCHSLSTDWPPASSTPTTRPGHSTARPPLAAHFTRLRAPNDTSVPLATPSPPRPHPAREGVFPRRPRRAQGTSPHARRSRRTSRRTARRTTPA